MSTANDDRRPLEPVNRSTDRAHLLSQLKAGELAAVVVLENKAAAAAAALAAKLRAKHAEKLRDGPSYETTFPAGLAADPAASTPPLTTATVTEAAPAPAVATPAAETDAVGAGKVGPLEPTAVSPPRKPREVLPPAAVATELAVQRREEAAAAALALQLMSWSDEACSSDGGVAYRCANAACLEPLRALPAAAVARQAECTAGCTLCFHAGSCAHSECAEAAWAADTGAPCPTPGCTGTLIYAAKMDGAGVVLKYQYGADAKAQADDAEKTRKKAAAAAAAAPVPTAKALKGTSSKPVQPKAAAAKAVTAQAAPAIAAPVVASPPRASASELAGRTVAYVIPARAARELSATKAAPPRRRAAAPPMPARVLASPPLSGAATPIPGAARLPAVSYDDDLNTTSSEDDELIEQAGRFASSPDGSFVGCDDDDDVASPASLYRGAPAGSEAAKLGAILAAHQFAAYSEVAHRTWAAVACSPAVQVAHPVAARVPAQQPVQKPLAAAVASAVVAAAPAPAPLVLRIGAAPYQHPLHKTALCVAWLARGCCSFGDSCGFAHGYNEQRTTANGFTPPPQCFFFNKPGGCHKGDMCRFTHE